MLGKKRKETVAMENAVSNGPSPVVTRTDVILVEPDVVPALFEVGLDAPDQFLIGVMPVAEENAHRLDDLLRHELMVAVVALEGRGIRHGHRLHRPALRTLGVRCHGNRILSFLRSSTADSPARPRGRSAKRFPDALRAHGKRLALPGLIGPRPKPAGALTDGG